MLKVATVLPHEPYREYKDVERVYSGSTEIDKILDKNGNVLFAVNKEVEGTPALTYKGKEDTNLKNYRIYGQTVDGESVGDRTGNLFDEINGVVTDEYIQDNGTININLHGDRYICNRINVLPNTTYTFSWGKMVLGTNDYPPYIRVAQYDSNGNFISRILVKANDFPNNRWVTTVENDVRLWDIRIDDVSSTRGQHLEGIMLNTGSTALPYEPYGYKVPVTVEGKNLCNNIWEQKAINANSGNAIPNENTVCCDFIPVKPNVTYSCSRTIWNNYNNLRFYGTNKNYLGTGADLANKANPLPQGASFGTFMFTDARVSYIRFNDLSNSLDTKYMLVEGVYTAETMPPYEPYHAPITTNLYLPEPIKMVGDEAEYIDYAEQKLHRVRKNLLQNTAISKTTATGLTITVNSDKSVIVDGTTNDGKASGVVLGGNTVLGKGTFIISGCPEGGDRETYRLVCIINDGGTQKIVIDSGDGNPVTLTSDDATIINNGFYLAVKSCDNKTFYPMIRKAGIEDDTYEPYIENTDLDVTLPALPTLSGTNTLTVGTEVQPSNVYLKGRIKEIA